MLINKYINKIKKDDFVDIEIGKEDLKKNYMKYLEQISMEKLCIKMFHDNMSLKFIINIGINIILSSMLIPTLFKLSNDTFILNTNMSHGIYFVIFAIGCEILSIIHKNKIIEPQKRLFTANVHYSLEDEINKNIIKINWNKLRDLNTNELERKKDMAKWYILNLINNIIGTFINLFSFFGYTFWIGIISPLSLVIYFGLLFWLVYWYKHDRQKNNDMRNDLWNKYYNLQTNLYTNIIHHNGKETLENMKLCTEKIELLRNEDKNNDAKFTDTISIVFNIGFIINCLLLINSLNSSDIIIYIQYSCLIRSSVSLCIGIYINWKDTKREYGKLEDIIGKLTKRIEVEQKINYNKITINSLKYSYPEETNGSNKPFKLELNQKLEFKLGQIIRLDGDSGNGKSTFSDIINGVIPFVEYSSSIYLDDKIKINGFDYLTTTRYYNEQQETICWKPSVYEIITEKDIKYNDALKPINIDYNDEQIVWKALEICSCNDFLKKENIINELKWIHSKNIGISGGQKGRIALARTVYRIIKNKPKFITLHEVDKSIQTELVVNIMENIFSYTKLHDILVFVICHSSEVKKLNHYDQIISFVKGNITKIN